MTEQLLPGETWDGIWDDPRAECLNEGRESKKTGIGGEDDRCEVLPRMNTKANTSPIAIKQISANIPAQ